MGLMDCLILVLWVALCASAIYRFMSSHGRHEYLRGYLNGVDDTLTAINEETMLEDRRWAADELTARPGFDPDRFVLTPLQIFEQTREDGDE